MSAPNQPKREWFKIVAGVALVGGGLLLLRSVELPRHLLRFVEWVRGAGVSGALFYGATYVGFAVLLLPAWLLTLVAGSLWGPLLGFAVVLPAATFAASAAFLLGRTVARRRVERKLANSAWFRAIDQAVAEGGLRLVLLLRLSPLVPYNVLNYMLGLTRVSTRDYIVGSALGMAPGTLLYLYLGSLATSASELLSGNRPSAGPLGTALYVFGLVATLAVTVWVTRKARAALSKTLASPSTDQTKETP